LILWSHIFIVPIIIVILLVLGLNTFQENMTSIREVTLPTVTRTPTHQHRSDQDYTSSPKIHNEKWDFDTSVNIYTYYCMSAHKSTNLLIMNWNTVSHSKIFWPTEVHNFFNVYIIPNNNISSITTFIG
jgi:hypothetical protein